MSNEVIESPAGSLSGWTRLRYSSGNERYRHDETGIELSARKFFDLVSKWKSQGYAPVEGIRAAAGTTPRIIESTLVSQQSASHSSTDTETPESDEEFVQPKLDPKLGTCATPGGYRQAIPHANNYQYPRLPPPSSMHRPSQSRTSYQGEYREPVTQIATETKPRPRDGRSSHKKPSAAALSIGIKKLALLITQAIVFRILWEDERVKMTEQEATMLGIALGNLLEPTKFNEEWGWIISETGDWQTLGYVLFMYVSRVGDVVREKRQSRAINATYNQPSGNQANQQQQPTPGSYSPGLNGASLRMNVSSTPIVHPPQQ